MPTGHKTSPSDVPLILYTFGGTLLVRAPHAEVSLDRLPPRAAIPTEPLYRSGKYVAVIAYLAAQPGRIAAIETLKEKLWPLVGQTRAERDSCFNSAMHTLRSKCGAGVLETLRSRLRLTSSLLWDGDAFLEAARRHDCRRALSLYEGEYLVDGVPAECEAFSEWLGLERDRWASVYFDFGPTWVDALAARGDAAGAEQLARRLVDLRPEDEEARKRLWRCLRHPAQSVELVQEIERFRSHCRAERHEISVPTRRQMAAMLGLATPDTPSQPGGRRALASFVGRNDELEGLLESWRKSQRGTGRYVHIHGQPGIGKSRLLEELEYQAWREIRSGLDEKGSVVLRLAAAKAERHLPGHFAGLFALGLARQRGARGISTESIPILAALHPGIASCFDRSGLSPVTMPPQEQLRVRVQALAELTRAVAEAGPITILVDDVQWVDAESQVLLGGIGRLVRECPLMLVTTARSREHRMGQEDEADELAIGPLDENRVRVLIESIALLPDDAWLAGLAARVTRAGEGIPLLVLETLATLTTSNALRVEEGMWRLVSQAEATTILDRSTSLDASLATLDADQRQLLTILAVAPGMLPAPLVRAASGLSASALSVAEEALVRRRWILVHEDRLEVAHDRIAETVLTHTPRDGLRQARLRLASTMLASAERTTDTVRHAAGLFRQAESWHDLERLFAEWFRWNRRQGDDRSARALAAELVGSHSAAHEIRRLERSLSLVSRLRWTTARRLVGGAILALALLGLAGLRLLGTREEDSTLLFESMTGDPEASRVRVTLRRTDWHVGEALRGVPLGGPMAGPARGLGRRNVVIAPSGDRWVFDSATGDSGTLDLFEVDPSGRPRRLTDSPGDDVGASWAPDGSRLAFMSARWNTDDVSFYDVAILDRRSRKVTRLTSGHAMHYWPRWSPDGTRIAFFRQGPGIPDAICWAVPSPAAVARCHAPKGGAIGTLEGWVDEHHVVFTVESQAGVRLCRMDVATGASIDLGDRVLPGSVQLSPDREWIVFQAARIGTSGLKWYVAPSASPRRWRPVDVGDRLSARALRPTWPRQSPAPRYVDRLRILNHADTMAAGVAHQLRAAALGVHGEERQVLTPLQWSVADPSIATIDSQGVVYAHGAGQARVRVEIPGWRSDSIEIRFVAPPTTTLLREEWGGCVTCNWALYGSPQARVLAAGSQGKNVLWNAGDGSYSSGAFTLQSWDGSDGLGVEAIVTTPITSARAQTLLLQFISIWPDAVVTAWDRETGEMPGIWETGTDICAVSYPAVERPGGDSLIGLAAGAGWAEQVRLDTSHARGKPFRVRLQLFPDGGCGLAVDGKPLLRTGAMVNTNRRFRINIGRASLNTRILVGTLEAWAGVRADVAWGMLERPIRGGANESQRE